MDKNPPGGAGRRRLSRLVTSGDVPNGLEMKKT